MNTGNGGAIIAPMSDLERGQALKRAALAQGLNASTFAKWVVESGRGKMDRSTVTKAFNGEASESSFVRLETALEAWIHETSSEAEEVRAEAASSGDVEFRISGDFGVEVVVRGPVSNMPELEESATRLIKRMRDERVQRSGGDVPTNG